MEPDFEKHLDDLRRQAVEKSTVEGDSHPVNGGPIPPRPAPPTSRGYYHLPVLKEPVWTWQIPLYFFIGGTAGMAAPVGAAALFVGEPALARTAFWLAFSGVILSAFLLAWDLGRPMRFIYMLRVFKWRSPMSVGSWILTVFGGLTAAAALLVEWQFREMQGAWPWNVKTVLAAGTAVLAAPFGALLSTYTGALLGTTAIPVWFKHRTLLPLHFGAAGLGSAAALLVLCGFAIKPLIAIGVVAALMEMSIAVWQWSKSWPVVDRPLRAGGSGVLVVSSEVLLGPLALVLWLTGTTTLAALVFLLGALLSRWGWLAAGRRSARDPEALFASQKTSKPPDPDFILSSG